MYKRLYPIGVFAYIIMLVLSLVFYKERTIFLDAAFTLFNIVKNAGFCIVHHRFGDGFSQLLPVIATKAGFSLNVIFASYSVSFILYYFAAYLICGSVLKRYDFAIVILLLNTIFVSETFYFILSPLLGGMGMLMVIYAAIAQRNLNTLTFYKKCLLLCAMVLVTFFHPLIIFVLVYSILFFAQTKELITDKKTLPVLAITYFVILVIKMIFFKSYYEGSALSGMKNFVTQFPDYFTLYSNKRFLYNCLVKYYWMPVLFIGITIFYASNKELKKLCFFCGYFIAYLLLVNISYPSKITPEFYIENLYFPLAIFLALPLVFDVLPLLKRKQLALITTILLTGTALVRIYMAHTTYTARLDFQRNTLEKYGSKKVVIKAQQKDNDILQMLWGTPYEFLLLSEMERHQPASIIIDEHPEKFQDLTNVKNAIRVNWETYKYSELPAKYFSFTDSTSGYTINP